jgi:hypothetical protein
MCSDRCIQERTEEIERVKGDIEKHMQGEDIKKTYIKQGKEGVKQIDGVIKQLRKEVKLEEEDLQAKIYGQVTNQYLSSPPPSFLFILKYFG